MVFQAGHGQTIVNSIQLSNCIFQMDYQNQKATMKPNEIFMWCSEQGKFRVRVDISHLACCLTTFHKPTLTFRKWKWKWQKCHSEEPQSKKGTAALLKDAISMVTLESPDCLTYWSSINLIYWDTIAHIAHILYNPFNSINPVIVCSLSFLTSVIWVFSLYLISSVQ